MTGPSVGPKKFGYIKTNLDRTKPFLTTPTLTFHYIILLFDPYQNFFRSVQNHNHLGSTEGQGTNQVIKYVNIDIYSYLSTYRKFLCHSHTKNTTYTRNNMSQKCEGNCGLWVLNEIIKNIYPENLSGNGLDWLCYLAGNSKTAPTIFFQIFRIFFKIISLRTIALTF